MDLFSQYDSFENENNERFAREVEGAYSVSNDGLLRRAQDRHSETLATIVRRRSTAQTPRRTDRPSLIHPVRRSTATVAVLPSPIENDGLLRPAQVRINQVNANENEINERYESEVEALHNLLRRAQDRHAEALAALTSRMTGTAQTPMLLVSLIIFLGPLECRPTHMRKPCSNI